MSVIKKNTSKTDKDKYAGTASVAKKKTWHGEDPKTAIKKEIEKYEKSKNKSTVVTTSTKKTHTEVTEIEKHVTTYVKKVEKELDRSSLDSSTKEKIKTGLKDSVDREIEDLHNT